MKKRSPERSFLLKVIHKGQNMDNLLRITENGKPRISMFANDGFLFSHDENAKRRTNINVH